MRWLNNWGALIVAAIALALSGYAIYMDNKHYQELTKPQTQDEETGDRLVRLDSRIETAEGWIHVCADSGRDTSDLEGFLSRAKSLREEAEKAWADNNSEECENIISQAYDVLDSIPQPPPPPPKPVNWWLMFGVISGVLAAAIAVWLVVIRREKQENNIQGNF